MDPTPISELLASSLFSAPEKKAVFLYDGLCLRRASFLSIGLLCEATKLQPRHCMHTFKILTPCRRLLCLSVAYHLGVFCGMRSWVTLGEGA